MRIGAVFRKLRSKLGFQWYNYRNRHVHWKVERMDGAAGFCLYGEKGWVIRFACQFFEPEAEIVVRRGWHWGKPRPHMAKMLKTYGLVLSGVDWEHALETGRELIWPRLLELVVPLPETWEAFMKGLSGNAKEDFRKVKRLGLESRISQDRIRLKEFYQQSYVPSMIATHQQRAMIQSWEYMEGIFKKNGEFVELWQGDKLVGGFVGEWKGNTYWFHSVGWKSGDQELRKTGIVSAVYFEVFRRAIERGIERVRLGGVPPILEGKLLAYKAKWRSRFSLSESDFPDWKVSVDPKHPSVRWFFKRNSLVLKNEREENFEVLSGRERDEVTVRAELMENIGKWHFLSDWAEGKTLLPNQSAGGEREGHLLEAANPGSNSGFRT